jgi:hypothetical protein
MEWFRPLRANSLELRMPWIDEPVHFGRCQSRGDDKNCRPLVPDEVVADLRKIRRRRCRTPRPRQSRTRQGHPGNAVGHFSANHHKICRWIVRVDVDKVFENGQRKMLGRVKQAYSRTRPAAPKAVGALTIEGPFGIGLSEYSVNGRQLRPPYAIRPRTFSTARAPGSVSINLRGACPPNARFGRLSHRLAFCSSPI